MYDLPWLGDAHDALWSALVTAAAREGVVLPARRERGVEPQALATRPELVLTQICGLPYAKMPPAAVRLVATPRYRAPGCAGAAYRSVLLGSAGRGAGRPGNLAAALAGPVAINEASSQSGHLALRRAMAMVPGCRPERVLTTGSHHASVCAVAAGRASLAAVDCVTWALIGDARPALKGAVSVIGVTPPAPGLPFVTRASMSWGQIAALNRALGGVMRDPMLASLRRVLRLDGVEVLPDAAYRRLLRLEAEAVPPLLVQT
ncbi:MAG: PhnD/SsuA/transferrin family substrate-binding protein [Pseudomonadota bacterium]